MVIYRKRGKRIYVTQDDIRDVQLAKAALAAGVEVLTGKARLEPKDLKTFYITGVFGTGLNKKSARNIGLIPKEIPLSKISLLKDGALSGTKKFLLREKSSKEELKRILAGCRHVKLHEEKDFEAVFARSMYF